MNDLPVRADTPKHSARRSIDRAACGRHLTTQAACASQHHCLTLFTHTTYTHTHTHTHTSLASQVDTRFTPRHSSQFVDTLALFTCVVHRYNRSPSPDSKLPAPVGASASAASPVTSPTSPTESTEMKEHHVLARLRDDLSPAIRPSTTSSSPLRSSSRQKVVGRTVARV
jgi:hypothetical protein